MRYNTFISGMLAGIMLIYFVSLVKVNLFLIKDILFIGIIAIIFNIGIEDRVEEIERNKLKQMLVEK
jgi:hypothetical protein